MYYALVRCLVAIVLALCLAGTAAATGPTIYVQNNSTKVTNEELANALPAFQASVSVDLHHYWGVDAQLVLGVAPAGAWRITVLDVAPCFCGGFHDQKGGVPSAVVGANSWQLVFTHELQEMLVDPWVNRRVPRGDRQYLVEVSDPVEDWNYNRAGADGSPVPISDFVTPAWYRLGSKGPYDLQRRLGRPFQLARGGYVSFWEDGFWQHEYGR